MTMNYEERSWSPKSAEIIGGNNDLLTEFLTFIPAKQVTRLKLVSKQWNSLITTPSFCHRHTLRHHHPKRPQVPPFLHIMYCNFSPGFYYYYQPSLNKFIRSRFTVPFPFVRIMQCCNGLLLLAATDEPCVRYDYFVCNATTMQFRDLSIGSSVDQQLCLLFDPLKSPHYKVIRFTAKRQPRQGREYTIDVYESETHSWKLNLGNYSTNNWHFNTGVYWNGGMYIISPENLYCLHLKDQIGAEGPIDERVIDRPPRVPGNAISPRSIYVVVSNGHLHSISLSLQTNNNKYVYVHELNKEDHSWFEKYRVDLNPIAHVFVDKFPGDHGGIVFGFVRGEREEDSSFVLRQPGYIMLYRLNNRKSLEVLVDYTNEYYCQGYKSYGFNNYYELIETLAPV